MMKKETIEQILSGKKTTLNVKGHIYNIEIDTNIVTLTSDTGSNASSQVDPWEDYGYTHGGEIYCTAVDAAREIRKAMIEKRARISDV